MSGVPQPLNQRGRLKIDRAQVRPARGQEAVHMTDKLILVKRSDRTRALVEGILKRAR
jgi:hypothetical protein